MHSFINILKIIKSYTSNGWIVWYVYCISIKPFYTHTHKYIHTWVCTYVHVFWQAYIYRHALLYLEVTQIQMLSEAKAVPMPPQYVNGKKNLRSKKMNMGYEDKLRGWKGFILQTNWSSHCPSQVIKTVCSPSICTGPSALQIGDNDAATENSFVLLMWKALWR